MISSVINLALDNPNQLLRFIIVSMISIIFTYLLYWITNRNRLVKFVPGIILVIVSFVLLNQGMEIITQARGLELVMNFGLAFVAGFVSLMFALILGVKDKGRRRRRKRPKVK